MGVHEERGVEDVGPHDREPIRVAVALPRVAASPDGSAHRRVTEHRGHVRPVVEHSERPRQGQLGIHVVVEP